MQFPILNETSQYREMTTVFGGYNHQLSCQEGQFFDMKNITSQFFPILSPRNYRGIVKHFDNPQGILDKEDVLWIDSQKLYINGIEKPLKDISLTEGQKTLAKMGAFVIITLPPDALPEGERGVRTRRLAQRAHADAAQDSIGNARGSARCRGARLS